MSKSKNGSSPLPLKTVIESSDDSDITKQFKRLINLYLQNINKLPENTEPELEVRFATKKIKPLYKIDFYNVIKSLLNNNFKCTNENYALKITLDNETSNIRTQVSGLSNIQHYCKYNNVTNITDPTNVEFVEKEYIIHNGVKMAPLDFDDYNFRIAYQTEKKYDINDPTILNITSKWSTTKKVFRYIKRFEYTHPDFPFRIHCSIVKTSKTNNYNKYIPQYTVKDADVFNSTEHYEIEIELDNSKIGVDSEFSTGLIIYKKLKETIKYVLIGIQQTNYPVSLTEQSNIISNYLKITKGNDYNPNKKHINKDFIGPSSATLQMHNIINITDINDTNKSIPNIRTNYTVTDKADGSRKLLFVNDDGKIYLINTLMNIEFTGSFTDATDLYNTIIDGEHILHGKKGEYINLFAAFDIYHCNGKNVTGLAFINVDDETNKQETNFRLVILKSVIKKLNPQSIIPKHKSAIEIVNKKFYAKNVFSGSQKILANIELLPYTTDGLIFTPANTGVASNKAGFAAPNQKVTWMESFKWKPPIFNTIDFLVTFKKNDFGVKKQTHIHSDGTNLTSSSQFQTYNTLILQVGYDEKKHGYINPCNDMLNDYVVKKQQYSNNDYKPARFYPTNPSDENAGICNIIGSMDESANLKIFTEEGEEIEDNTIVEFRYDETRPSLWKWVPLRMRYDKTSELRSGGKNFGNAYHVANSNWQSIHHPITNAIISTGDNVVLDNKDDEIYYNKTDSVSETRGLRDFHNLYVKNILINRLADAGTTIIDYACGKAGDLPKWINANVPFVFGLDLSKDNIENRLDGACARYLNYAKQYATIPKALFVNGNSSKNIRNGDAFITEKNKQIVKAIFGEGSKNEVVLGKGVYNNYGIAQNGFKISSIQFALHYMFENETILNDFLKNISQCTALEGYFIGTCYDGQKVFNLLNDIETGKSKSLSKNNKKIWEVTKKYSETTYADDETCIGYPIDVYQETINKTFREYLVNFSYLTRLLENYGFVPLNRSELSALNLPSSVGYFDELYNAMQEDINKNKSLSSKFGKALNMSGEEKSISFLNKYFVFKKVRNVDTDSVVPLKQNDDKTDEKLTQDFDEVDKKLDALEKESVDDKFKNLALKAIEEDEVVVEPPKPSITKKQQEKLDKSELKKAEKEKAKQEKAEIKKQEKEKAKLDKAAQKKADKEALKNA
jgi:hypothetical protein|tara:strand:- start:11712 stop:15272 length:3561 start_codon:yes stop_codon:yes gene_type:complete